MQQKKVSVIVPCYKAREDYLDRLMDSLLNQTIGLENMEIFLIDDGSPDDTFTLLKKYEKSYPDVICLIHYDENRKPGYARTLGITSATGEYVAFADQDDWVEYTMYEELYERAVAEDCDMAIGNHSRDEEYKKPQHNNTEYDKVDGDEGEYVTISQDPHSKDNRKVKMKGGYWSGIYKRQFLLDNQIYFPADVMWDDNFFGFLVHHYIKKYYVTEKIMYHWFLNTTSISMSASYEQIKHRMQVELLKVQEADARGWLEQNREEIEYHFFQMFYINTLHIAFTRLKNNPYNIYQTLRQTLLQLFPNVKDNPYIKERTPEAYNRNMYEQWDEFVKNSDKEIQELCKGVPESIRHVSWMDTAYQELTPEELQGYKIRYLLVNIGFQ